MSILSNSQGLLFTEISMEESKELQTTTLQGWFGAQQSGQARALVTSAVIACKGVVTHTVGEAVLSSFSDAASAVKAALEIQSKIAAAQKTPGTVARVRCALAYGPVRVLAGKVSGDAVTAAALLLDKAKPGEILAEQSVKDALGAASTVKLTPYGKVGSLTAYRVGDEPKTAQQEAMAKTTEMPRPNIAPAAASSAAPAPRPAPPPAPRASPPRGAETIAAGPQVEFELALTYAGRTLRFTRADGEISLGRAFENHIHVPARHVSRKHAKVEWPVEGPVLVNLSANGSCVRLEGEPIAKQTCADRIPLRGRGAIVLASGDRQSASGDDIVKFSLTSK
ncbi:MAG TPA: adenylate/guanylate cyclase domain-containing protein [Burkholderiales bacterium]|nr:adenylate/guanylate cyclase domain-containing protein [Burkholderiales bacterium]